MNKTTYEFGEFFLDLNQKLLRKNGQVIYLQPKVFDLLVHFAEHHGELVTRDELMKAVWKDSFVEETNLRF
nr:winged helix-turn-helix domain-containing protein [Pyrinomonadaceae bacterium]